MVVSIWWVIAAVAIGGCLGVVVLAMMRISSDEDERMDRMLMEDGRPLRDDLGPPTVAPPPPVKPRPYVDGDRWGDVSTVG
jgi:hypothetical protein